jgi:MoaA/NifB/PqqE/SkfB family radical SAM enzyme
MTGWCGACQEDVRPTCIDSFGVRGVIKAHWECWSQCNLRCGFCYRTRGRPLGTTAAFDLLRAVRTGGCRAVVFAGGDPSLRSDIHDLVGYAKQLGLSVELQTNADVCPPQLRRALTRVDLVGLSIDAANSGIHDALRGRNGNFQRVLQLLAWLRDRNVPTIVRSVVLRQNTREFPGIARLVSPFQNVIRWSVLQFSPIGDGFRNHTKFSVSTTDFESVAAAARTAWGGGGELDIYRDEAKRGTYLLITPAGQVYGTTETAPPGGVFPIVGSILSDHLSELAERLPFSAERHRDRYQQLLS